MHTQLDLRGSIPTCIHITNARQHDVLWLDELLFDLGAFYIIDRGYMDFTRLGCIAAAGAFFVRPCGVHEPLKSMADFSV